MALDPAADFSTLVPQGILETALYVDDLDSADQFYSNVMGLKRHSPPEGRHLFFYCGQGMLLLFNPEMTSTPAPGPSPDTGFIPAHGARGPGHMAFRIRPADVEGWRKKLVAANVAIESEVDWPAGGHSLYFRDPAGNSLELATPQLWGFAD